MTSFPDNFPLDPTSSSFPAQGSRDLPDVEFPPNSLASYESSQLISRNTQIKAAVEKIFQVIINQASITARDWERRQLSRDQRNAIENLLSANVKALGANAEKSMEDIVQSGRASAKVFQAIIVRDVAQYFLDYCNFDPLKGSDIQLVSGALEAMTADLDDFGPSLSTQAASKAIGGYGYSADLAAANTVIESGMEIQAWRSPEELWLHYEKLPTPIATKVFNKLLESQESTMFGTVVRLALGDEHTKRTASRISRIEDVVAIPDETDRLKVAIVLIVEASKALENAVDVYNVDSKSLRINESKFKEAFDGKTLEDPDMDLFTLDYCKRYGNQAVSDAATKLEIGFQALNKLTTESEECKFDLSGEVREATASLISELDKAELSYLRHSNTILMELGTKVSDLAKLIWGAEIHVEDLKNLFYKAIIPGYQELGDNVYVIADET